MLDSGFLFSSLIWGSVGLGYCIYGKKQQALGPFVGGVLIIAASYLVPSPLLMSLICVALMAGVFKAVRLGY